MPAFGIFRLANGSRESSGELIPQAELVDYDLSLPLFVNSGLATPDGAYGNCRSVHDSPFWVRYDAGNAPSLGSNVGPVQSQTYVSTAGGNAFVVLYKDTAKQLVWCAVVNQMRLWDAELTSSMSPASNSKTGEAAATAKLLVPSPSNPADLIDGPTIPLTNRSLDASGLSGDYCIVARIAHEWRLVWIDC